MKGLTIIIFTALVLGSCKMNTLKDHARECSDQGLELAFEDSKPLCKEPSGCGPNWQPLNAKYTCEEHQKFWDFMDLLAGECHEGWDDDLVCFVHGFIADTWGER